MRNRNGSQRRRSRWGRVRDRTRRVRGRGRRKRDEAADLGLTGERERSGGSWTRSWPWSRSVPAGGLSAFSAPADIGDVYLKQSEHAILTTVFLTQSATSSSSSLTVANLPALYASLLPPALALLSSTGTSLNALIKKSSSSTSTTSATTLHSAALAPLAFVTFQEIQEHMDGFEEWVRVKGNKRKENELGELSHAFRGTCLTSLPAVIEDTKVSQESSLVREALSSLRMTSLAYVLTIA
jgi:hypothetical protein